METWYKTIESPVGNLTIIANATALLAISWNANIESRKEIYGQLLQAENSIIHLTEVQLSEYFKGDRTHFDLPLEFRGTAFQKQVWEALLLIPYGETASYAQIAQRIGNPKAQQAVGAANGKNPIAIVAPCHRVLGTNGKLVGFAGGIENKAFLLELESRKTNPRLF